VVTTVAGNREGATTVSYLDDPDHAWTLDPATTAGEVDAEQLLADLYQRDLSAEDLRLIYRGARGLWERGQGTALQCLDTSIVWLFG
jgi:hypothetical protein